jgi:hypothetical protein
LLGGYRLGVDAKLRHRARLRVHETSGSTAKSDLVVPMPAQEVGPPDFLEPALPSSGGGKHQRRQLPGVFGAAKCRGREAPNPGQHAQCLPRRQIERPAEAKKFAPKSEQQAGGGQRLHQLGGDVAHVAEACPRDSRFGTIEQQDLMSLARQGKRRCRADDPRADHRDRVLPAHGHTVYDLRSRKQR